MTPTLQALIGRLCDEADLCSNEGADDIAILLNEAARALSLPAAAPEGVKPAMWQWRQWWNGDGGEPMGWGKWQEVKPRSRLQSLDEAVQELRDFIARGNRYDVRALYASPSEGSAAESEMVRFDCIDCLGCEKCGVERAGDAPAAVPLPMFCTCKPGGWECEGCRINRERRERAPAAVQPEQPDSKSVYPTSDCVGDASKTALPEAIDAAQRAKFRALLASPSPQVQPHPAAITDDQRHALKQTLRFLREHEGKAHQGYFWSGWAGQQLRALSDALAASPWPPSPSVLSAHPVPEEGAQPALTVLVERLRFMAAHDQHLSVIGRETLAQAASALEQQ